MTFHRLPESGILIIAVFALHLLSGCGDQPSGNSGAPKASTRDIRQANASPPSPHAAPATKAAGRGVKRSENPPARSTMQAQEDRGLEKIEWGREASADEIIAMAKNGEIREIEWHIMPNILRAVASDGRIFFVRNENKGLDMRGMLADAGVQVGKGGVAFRHVF